MRSIKPSLLMLIPLLMISSTALTVLIPRAAFAGLKITDEFSVASWGGGKLRDDKTGAFDSCWAGGSYRSGISLYSSVNKDWLWTISLTSKAWHFGNGDLNVFYRYDNSAWLKVPAKADGGFVHMYMPSDRTSADMFQASKYLEVNIRGNKYSFELSGTRKMFDAVLNCVSAEVSDDSPHNSNASSGSGSSGASVPEPDDIIHTGTGFFVAPDKVVTNNHVIEKCTQVNVGTASDGVLSATILHTDKQNDLAVLSLKPSTHKDVATFRQAGTRVGDQVAVFGFPLAGTLSASGSLTSGNVSSLAGMGEDILLYQISAPIQPGNSGGPLLDTAGNVIGVTSMKLNEIATAKQIGTIPQNVNFAIKASVVTSFLEAHSIAYAGEASKNELSLADVVDKARKYTVQVTCD